MAKLVVHGATRAEALARARTAVAGFTIVGPKSNLPFHVELLDDAGFVSGDYDTGIVGRLRPPPPQRAPRPAPTAGAAGSSAGSTTSGGAS
jgi:acetyl-CoA carboxylase biotin carboxylase subunit